jgi:hypothetical protein
MLPVTHVEMADMRKRLVTLYLATPRWKAEVILITYELIIRKTYVTLDYSTNSFYKNVLNTAIA